MAVLAQRPADSSTILTGAVQFVQENEIELEGVSMEDFLLHYDVDENTINGQSIC
jgi:hypothetical protein